MNTTKTIAVLLTCHNRKEKTLACLDSLLKADLPSYHGLEIFLVDDGSTDGTSVAILEKFPSVNIIKGKGSLFWNQGMRLAWDTASKKQDFDYYLWLNDDVEIYSNSILNSIKSSNQKGNESIICGATEDQSNVCTYSAYRRISKYKFEKLSPSNCAQYCEVFNGNFVLIPSFVFNILGNLDSSFTHSLGDFDYGLRGVKKNIKSFLLSNYIGQCESNDYIDSINKKSIIKRLKKIYSPLGNNPIEHFKYNNRHFGLYFAIKIFISNHLKII